MINIIVLCFTLVLFLLVISIVTRGILQKIPVFGHPPIPVFFFVLAKLLVLSNLCFLILYTTEINFYRLFQPALFLEIIAIAFLSLGTTILIITTFQLNKDLIFGLPKANEHKLQTKGLYSLSRHPFYLGFILILFSSCLLYPNPLNIIAFVGAWIIHHFIMIKEEKYLESVYGEEYRKYMQKVNRYLTLK